MKKNKVLKIVLIVLGALVVLLAAAALGVLFYLHSMAAGLPETLPDASADSTQLTLTDEDLDKLLSGEITLEELTDEAAASNSGEQEASASAPQEDAGAASAPEGSSASSGSADSRTESGSTASSGKQENTTGTSSSGTAAATEKPASSSGKQEAGYEAEVKVLLKQLYSVKARAEAELNSCIAGAKAEFKSLPESQQTQARKVSIVLARSGRLYAMQASYDKEVASIVSQMRAILTANGQSTALADQAMASYKAQKSAMYSQLTAKLYS
jgi:cobalamin biosynthesis Mg chelatase CobN